ncbi:MAG: MBL fold metallo-hydrolase [Gemmatimonadota bacterium]
MIVTLLGTGSKGNAIVIEADGERVLIDAGYPARTLARRLAVADIAPSSISALVLTHEHFDHARGARVAAKRHGWTVYGTPGTIAAVPRLSEASPIPISPRETLLLDTMMVSTVRTPHDGDETVGVVVESIGTGARCGLLYDLGHTTPALRRAMSDLDALVIESNHDPEMLRAGPYPLSLQRRIAGPEGHLSNAAAGTFCRGVVHKGLRHIVLVHLSEENNAPEVARGTVARSLRGSKYGGTLSVSRQHGLTRFSVESSRRSSQMSLFG